MSSALSERVVRFPPKLKPLFEPKRYKILYGGRGGAKSWGVARALLLIGVQRKVRILCAREIQKSMSESVHKLLSDQIADMGLTAHYEVQKTVILGRNGTEIQFAGLRHNVDNIKSMEGVDYVWIEEAQAVSKASWDVLIPTIRKNGSEIWVTFNPELELDETYQRFVVTPPSDSLVIKIGWQDNPWFPDVLRQEKDDLRARDLSAYLNVWEGQCKAIADGAIYADELRRCQADGRITEVPYDPLLPVHTFWDLGVLDPTSIWFAQNNGGEIRVIDYYEANDVGLTAHAQVLAEKGYQYGTHYAPHDIQVRDLSTGRTRIEAAASLGIRFEVVPRQSVEDGIHAVKMQYPRLWFDSIRTKSGIHCLSNYRRAYNTTLGQFMPTPVHDYTSHAADAMRYLAVSLTDEKPKKRRLGGNFGGSSAWMG